MQDGTGTTSYCYDELDRLLSTGTATACPVFGAQTGYRYDADGNRTAVIYPDQTRVNYAFDNGSRLQFLQDWVGRITSYTYFADGLLNTQRNVNGTTEQFSYDIARRLSQVLNQTGAGAVIDQHSYSLDAVGNRLKLVEQLAQVGGGTPLQQTLNYGYDHLYRLTSVSGGGSGGPTPTPTPTNTSTPTPTATRQQPPRHRPRPLFAVAQSATPTIRSATVSARCSTVRPPVTRTTTPIAS